MGFFSWRKRNDGGDPAPESHGGGHDDDRQSESEPRGASSRDDGVGHSDERTSGPDRDLPAITIEEARHLRSLLIQSFAQRGVEVIARQGVLVGADGMEYSLTNLASVVNTLDLSDWPEMADHFVDVMLGAQQRPIPTSLPEIADIVVPRLLPDDTFAERPMGPQAVALTPGLCVAMALDYPDSVVTLGDEQALADLGGWAAIEPLALANLRKRAWPDHQTLEANGGASIEVLHSDDHFVASNVLLFDELLASILGIEIPEHGVVFCVPNRHVLAFHVLTDDTVLAALGALAQVAVLQYNEGPGSLSPDLYYRSAGGRITRVTHRDRAEEMIVDLAGEFGEVVERLTGEGASD